MEKQPLRKRYQEIEWIVGVLLKFAAEMVNWYCLTISPPAILAPLGIISVMLNITVGTLILGERISSSEKKGYMIMMVGVVLLIITCSTKSVILGNTLGEIFQYCTTVKFMMGVFTMYIILIFSIISELKSTNNPIYKYVLICSLFATISVNTGKLIVEIYSLAETNGKIILAFTAFTICCAILQEVFKQKAITVYPISRFTPLMYAGFNARYNVNNLA
jgi:hypothetical protein